ncbi:hypothetical protein PR048_013361 [Dryococelus australis]|uniref:Uncharacterized protein n=1 Tax=Dryococelus australis TaxID=614101 RepID=A0ABQ9HRY8_9NEOP|nr:hypothetical protein PR048_013361 [Dryococelus australis]
MQELDRLNLDIFYCRGQAFDGGSNMSGKFKGVQHDAVLTFLDTLPCLPVILETISESSETKGSNAFSFLHTIQSSEFLLSVVVLAGVFGLTLPLARKL